MNKLEKIGCSYRHREEDYDISELVLQLLLLLPLLLLRLCDAVFWEQKSLNEIASQMKEGTGGVRDMNKRIFGLDKECGTDEAGG